MTVAAARGKRGLDDRWPDARQRFSKVTHRRVAPGVLIGSHPCGSMAQDRGQPMARHTRLRTCERGRQPTVAPLFPCAATGAGNRRLCRWCVRVELWAGSGRALGAVMRSGIYGVNLHRREPQRDRMERSPRREFRSGTFCVTANVPSHGALGRGGDSRHSISASPRCTRFGARGRADSPSACTMAATASAPNSPRVDRTARVKMSARGAVPGSAASTYGYHITELADV